MGKRIDIRGRIYNHLLVLRFVKNQNSHALWKCKCLNCRKATFVTYSNLVSGNTKSCASCGNRKISIEDDKEIKRLYEIELLTLVNIASLFNVSRMAIVNSLKRTKTLTRRKGRT